MSELELFITQPTAFTDNVVTVARSPDSQYIAAGSKDGSIVVLESQSLEPVVIIKAQQDTIRDLVFSTSGRYLVSGSHDEFVKIWEWQKGKLVTTIHTGQTVFSVAISPDEKLVASSYFGEDIDLWDISTGSRIRRFKLKPQAFCVAISPDGKYLYGGSRDYIRRWNIREFENPILAYLKFLLGFDKFTGHSSSVTDLEISMDGKFMCSQTMFEIIVWKLDTIFTQMSRIYRKYPSGRTQASPTKGIYYDDADQMHHGNVQCITFGSTPHTILTADEYESVVLWYFKGRKEPLKFNLKDAYSKVKQIQGIMEKKVVLATDRGVLVLNTAQSSFKEFTKKSRIYSTAVSPDGKYLAVGLRKEVVIYQLDPFMRKYQLTAEGKKYKISTLGYRLIISPDGNRVIAGTRSGHIILWRLDEGVLEYVFEEKSNLFYELSIGADSQYLVAAAGERGSLVYDLNQRRQHKRLKKHGDEITTCAISQSGRIIATAGWDKRIRIWDVERGKKQFDLKLDIEGVLSVAISPDESCIAGLGYNRRLWIWDAHTRELIQTIQVDNPLSRSSYNGAIIDGLWFNWDMQIRFSKDSKYIRYTSSSMTTRFYSVATGQEVEWTSLPSAIDSADTIGNAYFMPVLNGLSLRLPSQKVEHHQSIESLLESEVVKENKGTDPGIAIIPEPSG